MLEVVNATFACRSMGDSVTASELNQVIQLFAQLD